MHPFDRNATVYIVEHSHSDISWNWPIPEERAVRNGNLANALEFERAHPDFRWPIECVLYCRNWTEDHPETETELVQFIREGRIDVGATYTQPMEDCLYNELLVRQMYAGKRWFEKRYPGLSLTVAMNQDAPLRGLQTQQVYSKAGVRYLKGSRLTVPNFARWYSPDGSSLLTWYQRGYWGRPNIDTDMVQQHLIELAPRFQKAGLPGITAITWGHDYNDPKDFNELIANWNNKREQTNRPRLAYGSFREVCPSFDNAHVTLPAIHGGVPNWWIYENWPRDWP